MGGGRKRSADTPKGPPRGYLRAIADHDAAGEFSAQAASDESSLCALQQPVPFAAQEGVTVPEGITVRLSHGDPPPVMHGDRQLGIVLEPAVIAMRGCLEMGYEMAGMVESFDPEAGTGIAQIRGQDRKAA